MSEQILQDLIAKHERVALLEIESEASPRWLRIPAAIKYSGINRSRLFGLIAQGVLRTASLKGRRDAKRGVRIIDRLSLDRYLETLCQSPEEQLLAQSQELRAQEADLLAQQKSLARRQEQIQKQLAQSHGMKTV